jgi:hypothetical protein
MGHLECGVRVKSRGRLYPRMSCKKRMCPTFITAYHELSVSAEAARVTKAFEALLILFWE